MVAKRDEDVHVSVYWKRRRKSDVEFHPRFRIDPEGIHGGSPPPPCGRQILECRSISELQSFHRARDQSDAVTGAITSGRCRGVLTEELRSGRQLERSGS